MRLWGSLKVSSGKGGYRLYFARNSVFIGSIESGMDGYYVFWPDMRRTGYWDANLMRQIADLMDSLNKEFHENLIDYMEGKNEDP